MSKKTIPFWATLLTLLGLVILCSLGTWQLQRLEWKRGLMQEIEAQYTINALENRLTRNSAALERGYLRGRYQRDKEFKIGPRTHDGAPGFHIITPLKTESGADILINRGWVPLDHTGTSNAPQGLTTVSGLLRIPDRSNPFTPENTPEDDLWYVIDFDVIAKQKNLNNLWPLMLYAEEQSNSQDHPIAAATKPSLRNDHLQYAFFWFSMAGALIVIYALRFLRKTP